MTRNVHPPDTPGSRVTHGANGASCNVCTERRSFPTRNAHGLGENPQPLYSVCFDARELWGDSAEPRQTVSLDLWESYLEPASG